MSDTKMLQLVLDKINDLEKKMDMGFENVHKKMDKGFKKVNGRLDKIGASVAYLEDDTPTIKEFNKLERRVVRLEKQTASL